MKEYDYIHNASDAKLADMMEREIESDGISGPLSEKIKEAAARLRNIQRILDAKTPFNHEQFNV